METDFNRALGFYQQVGQKGDVEAAYILGQMYQMGLGTDANEKIAAKWYQKAAEKGHPQAQVNLGVLYVTGKNSLQDFERAHMWFNIAAASGDGTAMKYRDSLALRMDKGALAQAQKKARLCLSNGLTDC